MGMTIRQNKKIAEHPLTLALIIHVSLWLLAVGLPYALGWVQVYGPSYSVHASLLSMQAWGWLFVIGGSLSLLSVCVGRNPALIFTARAIASIIIMIWTVLWYVAALQPNFPGWSAVPTYTFIMIVSILTFYAPAIADWQNKRAAK